MVISVPTTGPRRRPLACQSVASTYSRSSPSQTAPSLVDEQHAVAIAVEGDAQVGAGGAHARRKRFGMGRTDAVVDVDAVGIDADRIDARAQFAQHQRPDLVGRAVGAVHRDAHAAEVEAPRHRALAGLDVAADGVAGAHRLAQLLGRHGAERLLQRGFDRQLGRVVELLALRRRRT